VYPDDTALYPDDTARPVTARIQIAAAAVRTRSMTDLRKVTKDRGSRAQVGVADGGLTSWSETPHESASVAGLAEYASHRAQTASVL
jgi:hypothetical protein